MPRDSHLLPEVSQQLLRAARAGRIYRPPTPPIDDDEKENPTEEEEIKETQQGFFAKKWSLVPRHLEEPEREHLAKRRKGLPPPWGGPALGPLAPQTAFRKTKVRKFDAEGNAHIYEVLAPEGQMIDGEVIEEDEGLKSAPVETAVAPGTVVEGVGVVNAEGVVVANDLLQPTPPKKKPPPPRRKPKRGPGRGKKKVTFPDTRAAGLGTPNILQATGTTASDAASESAVPSTQGDTPMPDAQDGDEDESGSEGEEGDEDGREDGELSPTPEPEGAENQTTALDTPAPPVDVPPLSSTPPSSKAKVVIARDASSSPELPLATKLSPKGPSEAATKNSTETSDLTQPTDITFPDGEVDLFGSLEAALGEESKKDEKEEDTKETPGA